MKKIISLALSLVLTSVPAVAFAEGVNVGATAGADVTTSGTGGKASVRADAQATVGSNAKARADQEINRRVTNLSQVMARVAAMKHLSDTEKSSLQASLTAQVQALSTLKAKIDADTDPATLKADIQSITKSYRIYALVIPQARIAASADRVNTIVAQMQTLGTKLQARISASTGADVAALQSAYADMQAKLADATTQAGAAVSTTVNLKPDNGDSVVATANTNAIKAARADIETATKDLKAAREDVRTILKGLKVTAEAGATTTVSN